MNEPAKACQCGVELKPKNRSGMCPKCRMRAYFKSERAKDMRRKKQTMRNKTLRPVTRGRAWTDAELVKLRELYDSGKRIADIADRLGRSIGSTCVKIKLLGLTRERPEPKQWSAIESGIVYEPQQAVATVIELTREMRGVLVALEVCGASLPAEIARHSGLPLAAVRQTVEQLAGMGHVAVRRDSRIARRGHV